MHISLFKIQPQIDFNFFNDALNIWTSIKSEDHSDFIIDQAHIYHHYLVGKIISFCLFLFSFWIYEEDLDMV